MLLLRDSAQEILFFISAVRRYNNKGNAKGAFIPMSERNLHVPPRKSSDSWCYKFKKDGY